MDAVCCNLKGCLWTSHGDISALDDKAQYTFQNVLLNGMARVIRTVREIRCKYIDNDWQCRRSWALPLTRLPYISGILTCQSAWWDVTRVPGLAYLMLWILLTSTLAHFAGLGSVLKEKKEKKSEQFSMWAGDQ